MVLEVVVLWAIVIGTVVWFVRDERRLKAENLDRAARHYAQAPRYRHVTVAVAPAPAAAPVAAPAPPPRTGGLTEAQRRFVKAYAALD